MDSQSHHNHQRSPPLPLHLCVIIAILMMFVILSWHATYEPVVEGVVEQAKIVVFASPLLLLLAVRWLSHDTDAAGAGGGKYTNPLGQRESFHRTGGTPWGLAFLLVFLFFMVSYQSQFRERWFPLLAR